MEDLEGKDEELNTSNEILVLAEFTDAYSFRCLIEYLNLTVDQGNLIFTRDGISFSKQNDSRQLLNDLYIFGHELTTYDYYSEAEQVVIGINISQFNSSTKQIGKKDIAKLSVLSSGICLQIIGSPKNGSGNDLDIIRSQQLDYNNYTMEGYQREEEPNFVTSIQSFTTACSQEAMCKDGIITLIAYDAGIMMRATQGGNLKSGFRCLGNIDESYAGNNFDKMTKLGGKNVRLIVKSPGELSRHQIPRKIISALGKLNNISPNGTVKFYIQQGLPIKLIFHVSTYGILTVYLREK